MTTHELASAILTLLVHDDAQTIADLHAALRCSVARLRITLQDLVDAEVLGTTRVGRATGYVLLEGGEAAELQPVELVVTAEVADQRAERSSTASLVLASESVQPARKPRAERRVIPATLDLVGAMTETQKRLLDGETLAELSARTVHPLRREVLSTELQATREDAERDQWVAEQDASIAERAKRQLVGSGVLLLVTFAPVLWLLSHVA